MIAPHISICLSNLNTRAFVDVGMTLFMTQSLQIPRQGMSAGWNECLRALIEKMLVPWLPVRVDVK